MPIVIDRNGAPLMPCTERKARALLRKGRATLVSRSPYTVMLTDREAPDPRAAGAHLALDREIREEFSRLKSLHRKLGLYPGTGAAPAAGRDWAPPGGGGIPDGEGGGREDYARASRWQDQVILAGIDRGAYVLDLGCGRGELLARLTEELGVLAQGVEVDPDAAMTAMEAGVPVLNIDLSLVLGDFGDLSFDYVILESTLQTLQRPSEVLSEMLRVGRRGVVSFPNFGHWRVRLDLASRGRMPVTPGLPYGWHDTPNIHLFTLDDMLDFCRASGVKVVSAWGLCDGEIRAVGPLDNLVTEEAILFLEKGSADSAPPSA
ncbi:MAG: methionine biosynthesis protein MetW [Deltaproteobacteria bacterium]|jgi:methionine biosynthesis protein MetW|nr:methionine biosynthesis protein MetW [Deltaproteobacteria bacterium]